MKSKQNFSLNKRSFSLNKLSIIVPAKNEEQNILQTLISLKRAVRVPYEVVVVDDCSTDRLEEVVKKYARQNKNIHIVKTNPDKNGFSNAIRKGLKKATGDIMVIVMADLCDEPSTINMMHQKILEGWDIVCGSRYSNGGKKIGGPQVQSFFSSLVCKTLYYLTGITTKDASNAFKMFRKDILKDLEYKPDSGVEASLDFILKAYFKGFKIMDVPTIWRGRIKGQSKFKLVERSPKYIKIYLWALAHHFSR